MKTSTLMPSSSHACVDPDGPGAHRPVAPLDASHSHDGGVASGTSGGRGSLEGATVRWHSRVEEEEDACITNKSNHQVI